MAILTWTLWAEYVHIAKHSDIYIDDGVGKPGFYARNKDTTVVGTVTAIIGAIVGSFLTKALEPPGLINKTPSSTTKLIDRER